MKFLTDLLNPVGGVVSAVEGIGNVLSKFVETPDQKNAFEQVMAKMRARPQEAQIEINKIEAGHRSIFVAGWRPAIGWVCAASLAAFYIPQYLAAAFLWSRAVLLTGEVKTYPVADDGLMELTLALLGMGALRSFEKLKGKSK